jgi:hypothetical protein
MHPVYYFGSLFHVANQFMKNVLLKFDSLLNLWCFKQKAQLSQVEIIPNKNILIGNLPEGLVELAIEKYKAELMAAA